MNTDDLLRLTVENHASDLHLRVGAPPTLRINGELVFQYQIPEMTRESMWQVLNDTTTEEQRAYLEQNLELDFAYAVEGVGRFRVNAHFQMSTIAMVFRTIHTTIPTIDSLDLPDICKDLALKPDGLVIVTGPTGCGKSTTLAAMLGYINERMTRKVITIEDPIEYIHKDNHCLFSQREFGVDTRSFANALKACLRQDPDVIMVGEMRDLETISTALTAAETGHLVLATLHTPGCAQAMDRIIDVFPPHQQTQVRIQLASCIQGILYQDLIPSYDGSGLVAAVEVLVANTALRSLIREGKTHQIPSIIVTGNEYGMQSIDQALLMLYRRRKITREQALEHARDLEDMKRSLDGMLLGR